MIQTNQKRNKKQAIKRTSVFVQLMNNILVPLIIILVVLSIAYIRYNYNKLSNFNNIKKYILVEELKTIIDIQDIALAAVEENLNKEMKEFSATLVNAEFNTTDKIREIDLLQLCQKYKMDLDIYIIDSTGEIINTTYEKDLGFNLFNINDEHKEFLKNTLHGDQFVSERLSLEKNTGKQKKYTYQPTNNNKYIVELGSYSSKATQLISSMNNGIKVLGNNKNLGIINVDLFISKDNKHSFLSENRIDEDHTYLFEKTFINKTDHDTLVKTNKRQLLYGYVYFEREQTNLYAESVIRIVFDVTNDRRSIFKEIIIFSIVLSLTLILLFFLFYKRAKLLTLPISNLEQQVKLIESGDLSIRATVSGNNEITSLSKHFNSMIEKLQALYQNLENKVQERTALLERQQTSITDSIRYAQKIQTAVLPPDTLINKTIPEFFIYYRPKDIVSGDFYWISEKEDKVIVAAVDCTGHGVPGGFMSMLGVAFLNEIVNKIIGNKHIYTLQANEILNQLRDKVIEALNQTGKEDDSKDGMDMALCIIDYENMNLQFSGANNPLFLVRDSELQVIPGDKISVSYDSYVSKSFTNHELKFKNGDMIYLSTDGYRDQFGGKKDAKFSSRRFRELLTSIANDESPIQKLILQDTLNKWMGENDQIDDILVIGIRLDKTKVSKPIKTDYSQKKILIVEDVEINYILIVDALISTKAEIIKAVDGLEAVNICRSRSDIDLVLMDVYLPKLNGFEATKQIKKLRPELPVVLQTALEVDDIKEKSIEAGCSDYFTKPIVLDQFLETINKYI